jgi:Fur family transcriptional regulator, ferric uptake regulator
VCCSCGRTVEVADPPVECWAAKIAAEHGFADVRHGRDDMSTSRFA